MKTKYFAFAALATMLASCSNDEDFVPQEDMQGKPITVTAGVDGMTTRAAGYATDNLPATFYLTIDQDGTDYDYTNVEMTKGSGSSYTGSQMLWKDSDRTPCVSAYTVNATAVSVETDQTTEEKVEASDLLGAISTKEGDITVSGDNININFRHLLCKLDMNFTWGTELSSAESKTITGVTIGGLNTTATLDRTMAEVSGPTTAADIQAYVANTTAEAIFAPSTAAPAITILTEIDGVERAFSLTPTAPEDGFVSGNRYTVNIAIGGTVTDTPTVTATGWKTSTEGENLVTQ